MHTTAQDWISQTFGTTTDLNIDAQQVIDGAAARSFMEPHLSFFFDAKISPGLCAIAIDNHGAVQIAAARMQQNPDSMTTASHLFLKLLCEDPAISLWQLLAASPEEYRPEADQSPLCALASVAGGFCPGSRYFKCALNFAMDGKPVRVWLIFQFDYMQQTARESGRQTATGTGSESAHRRKALRDTIRNSALTLDVVLERLSMTIGDCTRLKVGQILPLSDVETDRLSLSADTLNQQIDIGHGEMGVWKQQRALRLHTPVLEEFVREMAAL
ncbi:MAG: FliM/FliN family flagellar motor C-terminal domain-containing protein [Henriciella sp.]|nr:FliM/FliN family flagellar motor C-terminal domain-containing protein [Henriciella sp.]